MENTLLELERKRENISKAPDEDFYYELKEYLDFLFSKRKLKRIVDKILKQQKIDSKEYSQISQKLKDSLIEVKKDLEKNNIGNKSLKKIFKEFDDYISGRIRSSNPMVENLSELLHDAISIIETNKSISLNSEKDKLRGLVKEYYAIKEKYKVKEQVSEWFALINLIWIKEAIEKDLTNADFFEKLNYGLLKNEIKKVADKYETIPKNKRDEYLKYLNKVHGYFILELKKKNRIYFRPWWLILLLVTPLLISLVIYNPFVEYEINQKMLKNLSASEPFNQYNFVIGSFNESEVEKSLIVNYLEEWTRTTTQYKSYDLYFIDRSQISNPKDFQLKYNISVENRFPEMAKYQQSKLIYENIDLSKEYSLVMIPQITAIQRGDISQVEARFSYAFYIKKSWKEFVLKTIPLLLFWIAGVFALTKVFEKIFGNKIKED